MSVGNDLQEMENAVTKGAAKGDPMQKLTTGGTPVTWEDLGGPTPENSKPDDDSNKLATPGKTLAQVRNVVNKGAGKADPMKGLNSGDEVELKDDQEIVAEDEVTTDEVVAEEETSTETVVAEEETTEEEVVSEEETSTEEVVAEEQIEEEKIDVEEDLNALIAGEELSEEFTNKARTIFEAAIRTKVEDIKGELTEAYESQLVEEVNVIKEALTERLDSYLEYVAQEWVEENRLVIENGLKTEMTESFLEGMKSLFEEHYVTIPDEKYDVLNSMVEKLDEMESKLNEQIDRNVSLNRRLAESTADVIFAEVTEGLAISSRDKLQSLAEKIEFESETDYREKLGTLKESYFPSHPNAQKQTTETISEGVASAAPEQVSKSMEAYMASLGRIAKK
tara:strand:+ start:1566 stop:2747 length:1182 start_codon:yes stop_codon:yes gene_type:complete